MAFEFDKPVPADGYRWWYIDAISDCGAHAVTVILFVGSVFSPYYAWARQRGKATAEDYCACNVALYGRPQRWCMTERNRHALVRSPAGFQVGPSAARVDQRRLVVDVNEWAVPLPRPMVGQLTLELPDTRSPTLALDSQKQHSWKLLAPLARISVNFSRPSLNWQGTAYVDSNAGAVPLESSFKSWTWSRAHLEDGTSVLQYDVLDRRGKTTTNSLRVDATGALSDQTGLDTVRQLPRTRYWRMPRHTRVSEGAPLNDLQTLEDTPFYSRNRYDTIIEGSRARCIHESLDLDRFSRPWVRLLLPFRMPRIAASKASPADRPTQNPDLGDSVRLTSTPDRRTDS